jgi:hypothetical protein
MQQQLCQVVDSALVFVGDGTQAHAEHCGRFFVGIFLQDHPAENFLIDVA